MGIWIVKHLVPALGLVNDTGKNNTNDDTNTS